MTRKLEAGALLSLLLGVLVGKVSLMALSGGARTAGFVAAAVLFVAGCMLYAQWFRGADRVE